MKQRRLIVKFAGRNRDVFRFEDSDGCEYDLILGSYQLMNFPEGLEIGDTAILTWELIHTYHGWVYGGHLHK